MYLLKSIHFIYTEVKITLIKKSIFFLDLVGYISIHVLTKFLKNKPTFSKKQRGEDVFSRCLLKIAWTFFLNGGNKSTYFYML